MTTPGRVACWLRRRSRLFAGAVTLALAGCGSPGIDGEAWLDTAPDFQLERFFDGQVRAWGIVQDRKGQLIQRFTVDIDGTWENDVLTLDETFEYGFGEGVTQRTWTIEQEADGRWRGGAGDILDEAEGQDFGNAFRWRYRMDLPVGDSSYVVAFDDWIWAFDEGTIVNRSWITKFGITFAEVTIFMQRQDLDE